MEAVVAAGAEVVVEGVVERIVVEAWGVVVVEGVVEEAFDLVAASTSS